MLSRAQSLAAYIAGENGLHSICKRLSTHIEFIYEVEIDPDTFYKAQSWAKQPQAELLEAVAQPHGFLPHGIISDVHIFPSSVVMSHVPSDITALKLIFLEAWRQPDVGSLESYLFELYGSNDYIGELTANTNKQEGQFSLRTSDSVCVAASVAELAALVHACCRMSSGR